MKRRQIWWGGMFDEKSKTPSDFTEPKQIKRLKLVINNKYIIEKCYKKVYFKREESITKIPS